MGKRPQVLVKFKNGEHVLYDAEGSDEFADVMTQISSCFGKWVCLGARSYVRKEDVSSVHYLSEGLNVPNQKSDSTATAPIS